MSDQTRKPYDYHAEKVNDDTPLLIHGSLDFDTPPTEILWKDSAGMSHPFTVGDLKQILAEVFADSDATR
jgi:hypothetical protein